MDIFMERNGVPYKTFCKDNAFNYSTIMNQRNRNAIPSTIGQMLIMSEYFGIGIDEMLFGKKKDPNQNILDALEQAD